MRPETTEDRPRPPQVHYRPHAYQALGETAGSRQVVGISGGFGESRVSGRWEGRDLAGSIDTL